MSEDTPAPRKAFECRLCGECCKGEGGIVITLDQLRVLARYLRRSPGEFFQEFCELRGGVPMIRTGPDGRCILFQEGCRVHPVKPDPCRAWPFFENILRSREDWKIAMNNCPGIRPDGRYRDFLAEGRGRSWDSRLKRYCLGARITREELLRLLGE